MILPLLFALSDPVDKKYSLHCRYDLKSTYLTKLLRKNRVPENVTDAIIEQLHLKRDCDNRIQHIKQSTKNALTGRQTVLGFDALVVLWYGKRNCSQASSQTKFL